MSDAEAICLKLALTSHDKTALPIVIDFSKLVSRNDSKNAAEALSEDSEAEEDNPADHPVPVQEAEKEVEVGLPSISQSGII